MPTEPDLLPPNATPLERALALSTARIGAVPVPMRRIWNPWDCPAELLPWLAWSLSIDRWRADWSEFRKREETARAVELQRVKGTPASMLELLESYDRLIELVEWFEQDPPATPHTFEVRIPLDGMPADRTTAEFAREIVRDIYRTKPARSHFQLWLQLAAEAATFLSGAAQATIFRRLTMSLATGLEHAMLAESGEPILTETGQIIEEG